MRTSIKAGRPVWIGALGLACCAVMAIPTARAQSATVAALAARAQIQDLITRYYYNFGNPNPENFSDFYAKDAELILGTAHFKGTAGIAKAYSHPAGKSPSRKLYAFNVTISNPLIVVHGHTATAELIFTEYRTAKKGEAPHIVQGREYSTFVDVDGHWRYKTRQIVGGSEVPAGWKE